MTCFTQLGKTHQLQCNFPELTGTPSIAVYFTSTEGTETRVIDCVQLDDLYCNNENGFKCEKLSSDHAEFTVPEDFSSGSGSFRCQTPGLNTANIISCPWPPIVTGIFYTPDDVLDVKTDSRAPTGLSTNGDAFTPVDGSTFTSGAIAGAVLGSLVFIAVLLAIAFLVFRRLSKRKKEKNKREPGATQKHEDDLAYKSDKSICQSKSEQSIELHWSHDSGIDRIQSNYPEKLESIHFEECEESKQPLLTKHLRKHQEGDDKEQRANQRNRSNDNSHVGLHNHDPSSAESPDLKFTVEQDKQEFSGDIYKTFPLCRRFPRDSGYLSGEWDTEYVHVDQCSSPTKVNHSSASFS